MCDINEERGRLDGEISILAMEFDILILQLSIALIKGQDDRVILDRLVEMNDRLIRMRIRSMKLAVKLIRFTSGGEDRYH